MLRETLSGGVETAAGLITKLNSEARQHLRGRTHCVSSLAVKPMSTQERVLSWCY